METPTTTEQSMPHYGLSRLLKRAWHILFKQGRGKGRISRGEFIISWMVFTVGLTLITVLLSWISIILSQIVSLIGGLWSLGYVFRRAHDFGKSWKYVLIPFIGIFCIGILRFLSSIGFWAANIASAASNPYTQPTDNAYNPYTNPYIPPTDNAYIDSGTSIPQMQIGTQPGLMNVMRGGLNRVFGILALVFLLWYVVIVLNLLLRKGTTGDNKYGSDPLIHQPVGNGVYRGAWIILLIILIILSAFQKSPPQSDYAEMFGAAQDE